MIKAINDATLNKAGDIYQYLIALKDCFELRIDTLFQSPQIIDESRISGKTRLSGYVDRYNSLKP